MTRFEVLQRARREAHLAAAQAAWRGIRPRLDDLGVEYRLFGSFVNGDFMEHSDIDLMVMGDLDIETRHAIRKVVYAAERESAVKVDLQFAQDINLVASDLFPEQEPAAEPAAS